MTLQSRPNPHQRPPELDDREQRRRNGSAWIDRGLSLLALLVGLVGLALHFVDRAPATPTGALAELPAPTAEVALAAATATPTVEPTATTAAEAAPTDTAAPIAALTEAPTTAPEAPATQAPTAAPGANAGESANSAPGVCPATSNLQFATIPMPGPALDHPDAVHGDLNLALRGYDAVQESLDLVDIGSVDPDAPQMAALFSPARKATFTAPYQVHDWNWSCGEHGCASDRLSDPAVTLLGLATTPGETLYAPSRAPEIYGDGYMAVVLYAEEQRITLGYAHENSVAHGYAIHIEHLCVDPNLLAAYRAANSANRTELPALRNGEPLGTAAGAEIGVAIRGRGKFLDPRSRGDWWRGY